MKVCLSSFSLQPPELEIKKPRWAGAPSQNVCFFVCLCIYFFSVGVELNIFNISQFIWGVWNNLRYHQQSSSLWCRVGSIWTSKTSGLFKMAGKGTMLVQESMAHGQLARTSSINYHHSCYHEVAVTYFKYIFMVPGHKGLFWLNDKSLCVCVC